MADKLIARRYLHVADKVIAKISDNIQVYTELSSVVLNKKITKKLKIKLFAILASCINAEYGIKLTREQIACSLALADAKFVELKTGEGKTLSIVLCALYNSLFSKVNVVTVNDYLALRDSKICKTIAEHFNISVGYTDASTLNKEEVYSSNIVYSSAATLIFDYLSDGYFYHDKTMFKELESVIVDELDYVVIDNATSEFSVSSLGTPVNRKLIKSKFGMFKIFVSSLSGSEIDSGSLSYTYYMNSDEYDFVYNCSYKFLALTHRGLSKLEQIFSVSWVDSDLDLYSTVLSTLKATYLYTLNVDYVIREDKLILLDRDNGRLLLNSRLEQSLQTALEIKENIELTADNCFENKLSYQLFFSKFKALAGLSGTLLGVEDELYDVFGKETVFINSHSPSKRVDLPVKYCVSTREKLSCLAKVIRMCTDGVPVLVVCETEQDAKDVHRYLSNLNFVGYTTIELLVNDNVYDEETIIRNAGTFGTILISTNMVTRGTDIQSSLEKEKGLFVISLFKSYSVRIDNQLKGRTGRQGNPGTTQFIVSFEDNIWKYLKGVSDPIKSRKYRHCLSYSLDTVIASLQSTIDGCNYTSRKSSLIGSMFIDSKKYYISELFELFTNDFPRFVEHTGKLIYKNRTSDLDLVLIRLFGSLSLDTLIEFSNAYKKAISSLYDTGALYMNIYGVLISNWSFFEHIVELNSILLSMSGNIRDNSEDYFLRDCNSKFMCLFVKLLVHGLSLSL